MNPLDLQLRGGRSLNARVYGSFDFRFFPQAKPQRLSHLTLRPVVEKQIIAKAKAAGNGQSRNELTPLSARFCP
jgi:hypothetical protein